MTTPHLLSHLFGSVSKNLPRKFRYSVCGHVGWLKKCINKPLSWLRERNLERKNFSTGNKTFTLQLYLLMRLFAFSYVFFFILFFFGFLSSYRRDCSNPRPPPNDHYPILQVFYLLF